MDIVVSVEKLLWIVEWKASAHFSAPQQQGLDENMNTLLMAFPEHKIKALCAYVP